MTEEPKTEQTANDKETKPAKAAREPREKRERGPPADGVPSKTKVMVANLPYDLAEDKVRTYSMSERLFYSNVLHSLRNFSLLMSQSPPRLLSAQFHVSWSRNFKPAMSPVRAVVLVS